MTLRAKRVPYLLVGILLFAVILLYALPSNNAYAAQITARSLALSSSSPAASNATTTYTFNFTLHTAGTVKSVGIQICTAAETASCTAPTGFTNASATLASQPTGLGAASGWTIQSSPPTTNLLDISDASNATGWSGTQTIVFGNVQNPTTTNQAFYAWITSYSNSNWTGTVDAGQVAASTATQIVLTGVMPESLIFCTGQSISTTGGIPDCATATAGAVSFNQLFSTTTTAYASSQMAASTNAGSGYVITVSGATLTSGSNTIPAIGATAAVSNIGSGQFGLNLAADTDPPTSGVNQLIPYSAAIAPASNGTNLRGEALSPFSTGGNAATATFAFTPSSLNTVADSANGGAGGTDSQIYTSTYMVNAAGHQTAGTYTTTLTYICTPTF
jgi:hypothetical protein